MFIGGASSEEMNMLKEQNQHYEKEVCDPFLPCITECVWQKIVTLVFQVQRVTNNLKNARVQMATLSDTLLDVEKQRDVYR